MDLETSNAKARKTTCCGPGRPSVWGAFFILMGATWALSLAGVITFEFWPYVGALAVVIVGIGLLWSPREGAGRTL